ncbi:hypothetical protein [Natronocalculus amylovorans]|uniref:Uncharacterized protein n=1 Tax=Natronocalculus amylovorans TaxID=2917812 RepID=A0AAE3G0U7_9EURY|nr:hypothetical protein [Natronocalculus amylovorans]MCL9818300.1 hypothetical protein [Natronocalculus amylovorans]
MVQYMHQHVFQAFRNPISAFETISPYLKYYPPSDPYFVRAIDSHLHEYTDADIFKTIHVSPDDIEYCSPRFANQWELAGKVVGGEWDLDPVPFEEESFTDGVNASFYRSLEAHFQDEVPWRDTLFVQQVLKRVEQGHKVWTCSTRADVKKKCDRVDRLYERIAENGYRTHEERLDAGINDLKPSRKTRMFQWLKRNTVLKKDEVTVNIARNGTPLRFSGKHRLSIAKIQELDSIPVVVLARHKSWQDIRNRINKEDGAADISSELLDHPDLQDII